MSFQKTVPSSLAVGQPGDFYDATARRVTSYLLTGIDADKPSIGRVFTLGSSGTPQLGGTGAFAGILVNPMSLARQGLDGTQAIKQGTNAELADMGRIIVRTKGAAKPGQSVLYDTATGDILGTGEAADGKAVIPGAVFAIFAAEAGGVAIVQMG